MQDKDLNENIEKALKNAPESRHSYFQMKHFIIGKEPTKQAQMWQCLRELQTRKSAMDGLEINIEDTKDQIDLQEIEVNRTVLEIKLNLNSGIDQDEDENQWKNLEKREKIIRIRQAERRKRQLQLSLAQLEENLKFTRQEAKFFLEMFTAIAATEPVKDYDDLDAQKEYWNEKISDQINMKLLLQHTLDTELVKTALSLPEDTPVRVRTQNFLDYIEWQQVEQAKNVGKKVGE